ncbi:hypothetical protein [Parerythrobacter jejuensis]|uniref:Serine kinase n=1 Tax=Parerythrobacter jejuensis TaxID=795812 RepID=A0A845AQW2_9SPHN|nr:hypothetical protein [Parerythrobacter jejuensis]MXP32004.1 hypothetical protein [Parerythrobacter jejuensis]
MPHERLETGRDSKIVQTYQACGLTIASDLHLPLTQAPVSVPSADIRIAQQTLLPTPPDEAVQIGPGSWAGRDWLSFTVPGVAEFQIEAGLSIVYRSMADDNATALQTFLLGSALPAALAQRGTLVLHGSAVRIGTEAILLIGPTAAGKSAIAAAFMKRGYALVSDDICTFDREALAQPGLPHIKLWQDSAVQLGITTADLSPTRVGLERYRFPCDAAEAPVQVAAVYQISAHNQPSIAFEPVSGFETFEVLRAATHRSIHMTLFGHAKSHLKHCARLVENAPVTRVRRPNANCSIDEFATALLDHRETQR